MPGAAVSATMGPEGGELTAADPERGRSYRLTVPAGAFARDTDVTVSPIAAIDGFPLEGDLLGGVELAPEGAVFLTPVALEITLDADQQAELRTALDEGQAVVGFHYPGDAATAADALGITIADVADDLSTVRLTLFSFSGHGAGTGNPQNVPCPPDPVRHAQCEIIKILHPPGGPADPADPAIRGQIANVFRVWLDDLKEALELSVDYWANFGTALAEANDWHFLAHQFHLVSEYWYASGDELAFEGARLEDAVFRAYATGVDQANRDCIADQTLEELLGWIQLHDDAAILEIPLPPYSGLNALGPSTFCLDLGLVAESFNPTELADGASGEFQFRIRDASGALLVDTQLDKLRAEIIATPANPSLLSATGDRLSLIAYAHVTALSAVRGSDDEGEFTISLRLFGLPVDYASETATFDITPADADPIRCSGDPTTIRSIDDDVDKIAIIFDGSQDCSVLDEENSRDDDPNIVLRLDTDARETVWDGDRGDGGINWRGGGEGDNQAPGTYTFEVRHVPSGALFTLAFTVEVALIGGGPDVTMTVRDVTITPLPG